MIRNERDRDLAISGNLYNLFIIMLVVNLIISHETFLWELLASHILNLFNTLNNSMERE